MRKTDIMRCDICGKPIIENHENILADRFHVKVTLRGKFWSLKRGPYWQHYDICNRCMQKIFEVCQKK